jgi:hypothetical protein
MGTRIGLGVVACLVSFEAAAEGPCNGDPDRQSRQVSGGIVLVEESCADPLYRAYVVRMDLPAPGYRFFVTPYEFRRSTTSEFAAEYDAVVAVNGGFWGSSWGGFTMSDGHMWPGESADDGTTTVVGFGDRDDGGRLRVEIRPEAETLVKPKPWMTQALLANAVLVDGGVAVEHPATDPVFKNRNPRTACGITGDGSTLLLVVVDGRQDDWSRGMKMGQLSELLIAHGAWRAANLDGGSSTTLVVPDLGGLVNRPSFKKAAERPVWNHLGILRVGQAAGEAVARILDAFAGLGPAA